MRQQSDSMSARLAVLAALAIALVPIVAMAEKVSADTPSRPNIVVVMVDDLPPHDGRLWNDEVRTPALHEHFVERGRNFTNAIAETPLCCPARSNFLTGLHTHNHGVKINDVHLFNPAVHMGQALKDAGYATMLIGKYMNRNSQLTAEEWAQHGEGWTYLDAIRAWNADFWDYTVHTKTGNVYYPDTHSTQMIAERAVAHIDATPDSTPVFALLTVYNMHAPNTPLPQFVGSSRCDGIGRWKPENYNEVDVSDKPEYIRNLPLLSETEGWPLRGYCEEILGIDWLVAQVTAELQEEGRLDNTLLVFTSDHGVGWGAHRIAQKKLLPYVTPVPLMMSWPQMWGETRADVNDIVSNIDLAPTFCDLAGPDCTLGPYPGGQQQPDGMSIVPLFEGANSLGRPAVLESAWNKERTWTGLRTTSANDVPGRWHYVEWASGERELYDLQADPFEMDNIAYDGSFADVRGALAQQLAALRLEGVTAGSFRPDATIALESAGPYKGDNIYRSVPVKRQTQKRIGVQRRTSYDYFVRVENDGATLDTIAVRGSASGTSRMRVSYFVDGTDVTTAVSAGTLQFNLAPAARSVLTVRVTVGGRAVLGSKKVVLVTASSMSDPSKVDVVRAVAKR